MARDGKKRHCYGRPASPTPEESAAKKAKKASPEKPKCLTKPFFREAMLSALIVSRWDKKVNKWSEVYYPEWPEYVPLLFSHVDNIMEIAMDEATEEFSKWDHIDWIGVLDKAIEYEAHCAVMSVSAKAQAENNKQIGTPMHA